MCHLQGRKDRVGALQIPYPPARHEVGAKVFSYPYFLKANKPTRNLRPWPRTVSILRIHRYHDLFTSISTRAAPLVNAEAHVSYTSSHSVCAVLHLEQRSAEFTSCSDSDSAAMGELFVRDGQSWADSAHIPVEQLILVTGFYKTGNWEAAVLTSDNSSAQVGLSLDAAGVAGGGLSINWASDRTSSHRYSTGHCHPGQHESPTISNNRQTSFFQCCHASEHKQQNQCIFLRGYRFRDSKFLVRKLVELEGRSVTVAKQSSQWLQRLGIWNKLKSASDANQANSSTTPMPAPAGEHLESIEGNLGPNGCVSNHRVNIKLRVIDLLVI